MGRTPRNDSATLNNDDDEMADSGTSRSLGVLEKFARRRLALAELLYFKWLEAFCMHEKARAKNGADFFVSRRW